jgi:V/A-type H+-transporting ATPase subunit D
MAIKFQYNKTELQRLKKQLSIRERALPTLKNKESALRMEVKKAKNKVDELEKRLDQTISQYDESLRLWVEFDPELVGVREVVLDIDKIAGVRTPVLKGIHFDVREFSIFVEPKWYMDGIEVLKQLAHMAIEKKIFQRKMEMLDHARKKTTQKVNLYEKVQIPGYQDAIRKINRYLEDEENLSKAAQKIVKSRQQKEIMDKAA